MMKRTTVFVAIIASLVLGACGGSAPEAPASGAASDAPTAQSAEQAAPAAGEAVTIQFLTLQDDDFLIATSAVIDAWKKSDPQYANVTVNVESVPFAQLFPKIETAVASGSTLDLFLADGPDIKHYAYNKAIIPLDKYFTAEELKEFVPINVEAGTYKGTFYSPGIMESCSMMFYNQDMTDAAGVKPPQDLKGWTMAEAKDAWQKSVVKDSGGNVSQWGLRWGQGVFWGDYELGIPRRSAGDKTAPQDSAAYKTFAGVAPDGITFQGYMDTPQALMAFEDFRSWFQGDSAVTPQEPIQNIFFNKQAAFYISPDNAIGTIKRLYPDGDFKYGVTGIPYYKDGTQLCHTDSWHFGVSPQSQHQDIAAALVKYMTGPEGAKIWYDKVRQLPARFDLLNTLPEYNEYPQQLFSQGVQEIGVTRIQTPGYTEYQQVFAELMQNLAQSDAPVDQLVSTAVSTIESSLAKYKGWDQ